MSTKEEFVRTIAEGNAFKGESIALGGALYHGEVPEGCTVRVPLRTMNRHGLICGATGSGKTKTLQVLAEQLSLQGVPSLLMDVKGDLSGIAAPGQANEKIAARHAKLGIPYEPVGMPVELLSLSKEPGARMRATVSEFGPVLLGRILELNDTQQSVLALVFKYCDDHGLPLLDLKDLRRVLQFVTDEGKDAIRKVYGQVSPATVNIILRKLIEIEQQGADRFFGERSFDVSDLLQQRDGKGVVHIVRLTDIQDKPRLFSTFMLCLLAEVYGTFPEVGDPDKPRLVLFIDEAHLIFSTATKALLEQIETIIKLIRSKGVGVYFCTQDPSDVPESVLGQLGLKVQHALRAFTAKDRTTIRKTARNYPITPFYDVEELITSLGIGEALVTALSEKGTPTPLAHTLLRAPMSRMDILSPQEIDALVARSQLVPKYNAEIDRESAFELLEQRMRPTEHVEPPEPKRPARPEPSAFDKMVGSPVGRTVTNTIVRELTRGLLGVLGLRAVTRRRR
ncbi:MAG: helicase HerA-like domain-containing protein [Flavobacteriales bacterium]